MPANGISSKLRAHSMAPGGVTAHCRSHYALELPSNPLVSCTHAASISPSHASPIFFYPPSSRHSCPSAWGYCWFVATFGGLRIAVCVCWYFCFSPYNVTGTCFPRLRLLARLDVCKGPDPSGGRGEMATSHPRCARLFFLHSEPGQDAPARCSVCPTGACSSQMYSAKCFNFNGHRHWSHSSQGHKAGTLTALDTGASGRSVSFKLVRPSSSRNRARASGIQPEMVLGATTAHKGSWC